MKNSQIITSAGRLDSSLSLERIATDTSPMSNSSSKFPMQSTSSRARRMVLPSVSSCLTTLRATNVALMTRYLHGTFQSGPTVAGLVSRVGLECATGGLTPPFRTVLVCGTSSHCIFRIITRSTRAGSRVLSRSFVSVVFGRLLVDCLRNARDSSVRTSQPCAAAAGFYSINLTLSNKSQRSQSWLRAVGTSATITRNTTVN
jgi:hypothetical protein